MMLFQIFAVLCQLEFCIHVSNVQKTTDEMFWVDKGCHNSDEAQKKQMSPVIDRKQWGKSFEYLEKHHIPLL